MIMEKLLEVNDLTVTFNTDEGKFKAVDNLSFSIKKGEIIGLVGESGCGKSVTALSIPRLILSPPGKIEKGEILFKGKNLLGVDAKEMQNIRGKNLAMIFQDPSSALSPLQRVGHQMVEALRLHQKITKKDAWEISINWLKRVKIPNPTKRIFSYPFQLSGGMQQRVIIAMALMMNPDLIIADEPTTSLDVTTQAQIFELLEEMDRENRGTLLITHDMGVVWEMCTRVIVMYASRIAEQGTLDDIFFNPQHPYTMGLLESMPKLTKEPGTFKLKAIDGYVPSPLNYPSGCHFQSRCSHAFKHCQNEVPPLIDIGAGHKVSCFLKSS